MEIRCCYALVTLMMKSTPGESDTFIYINICEYNLIYICVDELNDEFRDFEISLSMVKHSKHVRTFIQHLENQSHVISHMTGTTSFLYSSAVFKPASCPF